MLAQMQNNSGTFFGRYFNENSILRRLIRNDDDLRVLSFGCAGGEELATLRALYPNARLFGCDTDWSALEKARALTGGGAVVFSSVADEIARYAPYDVIVCNSVLLTRPQRIDGALRGIDPAQWTRTLDLLDDCLAAGGVLQIINSHIPFRMHPRAGNFRPVGSALITGPNFLDLFSADGVHMVSGGPRRFTIGELIPWHYAEAGAAQARPSDFHDVLFRKGGGPEPDDVVDQTIPNGRTDDPVASGSASFRPTLYHKARDQRPITHVEVDVAWQAFSHQRVRLERTMRRIWFDGAVGLTHRVVVDLDGDEAVAFLDAATGRRPVPLAIQSLSGRTLRRAP